MAGRTGVKLAKKKNRIICMIYKQAYSTPFIKGHVKLARLQTAL
jgi:hypothetical protein